MRFTSEDIQALALMPVYDDKDPELFFNPPKAFQEQFVGASFQDAYDQAGRFLNYVVQFVQSPRRVLDFGCGWGRMLRLLARKMPDIELHGCDTQARALESIRRSLANVYLTPCGAMPPSRYGAETFDLIYAFSVYSHLSPEAHNAWAQEFARLLVPGGYAVITTQGLKFLQMCKEFRDGTKPITHQWHQSLAVSFAEPDCGDRYLAGEFLYSATSPANPSYGEAMVPRQYFERHWGDLGLELIDWNEETGQNWGVLRKK